MTTNEESGLARIPLNETPITYQTLKYIINTPTVPVRYRESATGVADMYAATLYGRELGIGPMTAISQLYLVNGQASMMGQLMLALVWRAGHRVKIDIEETGSTVTCFRDGTEVGSFTFTVEDAARAGLLDAGTYEKYPKHMLTWRAVGMACRLFFPDVITGVKYVPQEIDVNAPVEILPEYVEVNDSTGTLEMEQGEALLDQVLDAEVVEE